MHYSFLKAGLGPNDVPKEGAVRIPRLIWQTVRDMHALDPEIQTCVHRLRTLNLAWKHQLFDDRSQLEFLQSVCSDRFMRAYHRIAPEYGAARADLFRYVAIFLHGGAYFDIKSGTSRPLDEILHDDDEFLLSQWDNGSAGKFPGAGFSRALADIPGGEFEQWFIVARPGHPYLAAVLEQVIENIETYSPYRFGHGAKGVLNLCGPNAYTRTIHRNLGKGRYRKVVSWPEGIRYTMLGDLNTHKRLDKNYYGRAISAPVTDHGLEGWQRARYWLLEGSYWPYSRLRWLNHRRLYRRKIRNKGDL